MPLALRDLDTGLFFDQGEWTTDPRLAQHFKDKRAVEMKVLEYQIKNAELVVLNDEFQILGGTFIPLPPISN